MCPLTIEKPRLPKALAYPLKTSLLEACLASIELSAEPLLRYWTPQGGGSILEAHYWLPNQNVSHTRVYIRAGSLPREQVRGARELLEGEGLPSLAAWLSLLENLPANAAILAKEPWFEARFREGKLFIRSRPAVPKPAAAA